MNRRDWLKRTSLALAGGLVLGDEVMEQYERLTHKKVWALGSGGDDSVWIQKLLDTKGYVNLPAGTYRIGTPIRMPSHSRLFGDGAELRATGIHPFPMIEVPSSSRNVVINSLILHPNGLGITT